MENGMLTVSWPRDPQARISDVLFAQNAGADLGLDTGMGQSGLQEGNSSTCV